MNRSPQVTARRRVLAAAAGVVALAAVIAIGSALSSPTSSDPSRSAEEAAVTASRLAAGAEQALSREDTSTALLLAERALSIDPANETAARVASAVSRRSRGTSPSEGSGAAGGAPSGDGAATSPGLGTPPASGSKPAPTPKPAPGKPDRYDSAVRDTGLLIPASFRDWQRGRAISVDSDTQVTFEPLHGTPDSAVAVRALVYVHDTGSPAGAARFLTDINPTAYPTGGRKVTVGDGFTGYSGSSDRQVIVSFARGNYAFEAVVTAQPGVATKELLPIALELANTLPAASR